MQRTRTGYSILALCFLTQISKILVKSNKQQPKEKPSKTNKINNLSPGFFKHSLLKY